MSYSISTTGKRVYVIKITENPLLEEETRIGVLKWNPVLGANLTARDYFNCISGYYSKYAWLLTPAEVGCALSHIEIYKMVLNSDYKGAIIFESDINISECDVDSTMVLIDKLNPDFLHIGWHPNVNKGIYFYGRKVSAVNVDGLFEIDPTINFYGTYAYFVSKSVCEKLIEFHSEFLHKADDWGVFFRSEKFRPYFCGIVAHPIERSDMSIERGSIRQPKFMTIALKKVFSVLRRFRSSLTRGPRGFKKVVR